MKAVIYDLDGTLFNSLSIHVKAYKYALISCGITVTRKQVIDTCLNKTNSAVAKHYNINESKFSKAYMLMVGKELESFTLYPYVIQTLSRLKKNGLKIGIGTGRTKREAQHMLKLCKIKVDVLITQSDVTKNKPDVETYRKVLKQLKVKASDAIIVGDCGADIIPANTLGATSVLYFPKANERFYTLRELKRHKPDHIIRNHRELLLLVDQKVYKLLF